MNARNLDFWKFSNVVFLRRCTNFMSDIKDSEIYSYLLKQIAPNDAGVTMEALTVSIIYYLLSSQFLLCKFSFDEAGL